MRALNELSPLPSTQLALPPPLLPAPSVERPYCLISDESDDLAWFPSLSLPDVDASVQALREDAVRALSSPDDHPSQPLWVSFG